MRKWRSDNTRQVQAFSFGKGVRNWNPFVQGFFESQNLQAPVFVAKKIKKDADAFKQHLPLIHALWRLANQMIH